MAPTDAASPDLASPEVAPDPFGRMRLKVAVVVVALSAVISTVVCLNSLDSRYGPVSDGGFEGPQSFQGLVGSKDGFSVRLASAPGTTAEFIKSLSNDGTRAVTVTSVSTDPVVTQIRWAVYKTVPDGSDFGVDMPWRTFPATIPAQGTIKLRLTVRRPADCAAYKVRNPNPDYYGGLDVRWRSLLHTHDSFTQFGIDQSLVTIC